MSAKYKVSDYVLVKDENGLDQLHVITAIVTRVTATGKQTSYENNSSSFTEENIKYRMAPVKPRTRRSKAEMLIEELKKTGNATNPVNKDTKPETLNEIKHELLAKSNSDAQKSPPFLVKKSSITNGTQTVKLL